MKKIKLISPIITAASLTCMLPLTACTNYQAYQVSEDEWKDAFTKLCSIEGTTNWATKEGDYIHGQAENIETNEIIEDEEITIFAIANDGCYLLNTDKISDNSFLEYNIRYEDLFLHYQVKNEETINFELCAKDADKELEILEKLNRIKNSFLLYYKDMKFDKKSKSYTYSGNMGEAISLKSSVRFEDKKITNISFTSVFCVGSIKNTLTCNLNPQYGQASINQDVKTKVLKHVVKIEDMKLDEDNEIVFANIGGINETEGFILHIVSNEEFKYLCQNLTSGQGKEYSVEVFNNSKLFRNYQYARPDTHGGYRFLSFHNNPIKKNESFIISIKPKSDDGKLLYKETSIKFKITNTKPPLP